MDFAGQAEAANRIELIRTTLTRLAEDKTKVKVRANMGRSKIVEREGILEATHPALFVVKVQEKRDRTARASYQYVDILTGTVELTHVDTGESLLPWLN